MFDGSHRTNKREINYAGASASSKSSRKTNLNVARQQRLQRAQAKAKLNSAKRLQRCWRGSSCRRSIAIELSSQYQTLLATAAGHQQQNSINKATSLLAFRMSNALIPFYSSSHQATTKMCSNNTNATRKKDDIIAETSMRKDLILLSNMIQGSSSEQQFSPIASQKIVDVTLILLRQSINHNNTANSTNRQEVIKENQSLVQLLGYFLVLSFFNDTDETVDNLTGWMINIFLLFRDYTFAYKDGNNNKETTDISSQLLKWCCQIVIRLVQPKDTEDMNMQEEKDTLPLTYQQGLALLASILFGSSNFEENQVVQEQLNSCLLQCVERHVGEIKDITTFSLMTHYLATSMSAISATTPNKNTNNSHRKVPGLMTSFQTSSPSSTPLLDALRDTLSSREFIVMNQILSIANNSTQKQINESRQLITYAIPIILQYTLQQQSDLAVLSSFAAQGQNINSWFSESVNNQPTTSIATAAAAAAFEGEDVEDESDDDEQDAMPAQQHHQPSSSRDNKTSTGRYSRTDLLTLPKLDTFYQTNTLQAKKVTVDRLRSLMSSHGKQVAILISLAEKIGRGDWIQLSSSLFSSTDSHQSLSSLSALLAPTSLSSWQNQAQKAYTSALATIMTTFSGIKAGRNAASPLLSKLAFNETFVYGMWERTRQSMAVLVSQSKNVYSSAVTSACEMCSSFCDTYAHTLLAVDDDDFLKRYYQSDDSKASGQNNKVMNAKDIVLVLKTILNDLYWVRPVLASDITSVQSDPDSALRFQRARLLLAGTKLFNSLHERWCRLYRVVQFCSEDCWWFPQLASRGQHDNNPIISAQETTLQNDDMDDSSVESDRMMEDDEADPMSANDAGGDALASAFKDAKMARVLTFIPMAMPFSRRVNLFNSLLESDKARTQDETASFRQMMMNFEDGEEGEMSSREKVTIRRDALYSDSKRRLNNIGKRLRKRVQVTFVNKHGQEEAGIDGGGVFKEFLDDLITDGFLPENDKGDEDDDDSVVETHPDFFVVTPLQTLKVNTALDGNGSMLSHYEFLGRVLGKAIYESILVEPQFCLPFLNKLLGKQNSLDDLKNLDPEYYKNLKSLRHMNAQEIENLGLTFELHESAALTIELMPGGSKMAVTKDNVIQYIHLVSHQMLNVRGARQTAAFLHGFRDIVPAQWVRLFSAYELQKLISGDDAVKGIDVGGMMSVMRYSGGLHPSQPIVQWLWQVVDEMSPEQQRKFLKFMTSCSRQPLLGFGSMVPAPCIQQTRLRENDRGEDIAEDVGIGNIRLPSSSTCMNLLKLPKYTSKQMLKEKLLYAIESAAGFELS